MADPAPSAAELANLSHHLSEITSSVAALSSSVASFRTRLSSSAELTYPAGISLLSLKNHLLLSYLHHLVSLFSLKLNAESIAAGPGAAVVEGLVKLRVVLEKIGPLEGKLKYQIEKLVRKADSAAAGGDVEDVINDPLAFRPNPSNLTMDRNGSDEDEEEVDDFDMNRAGIYRPPRIAAMPYSDAPTKGKKGKGPLPSHMLSDLSAGLSSSTPYGESTSGLSVTVDPSLSSGTARHLAQIEDYELSNYTRMRGSKKESAQRRRDEEEVAFGGLGAGKNGKRRLGGFGAELDDLLGDMEGSRAKGAYEQMRGMKRAKVGTGGVEKDESAGTSGLAGLEAKKKGSKGAFDRAVVRAGSKAKGRKST